MFVVKENEKMFIRKHQEYDRLPIDEYLREVAWAEGLVMDKKLFTHRSCFGHF